MEDDERKCDGGSRSGRERSEEEISNKESAYRS
jgi:hypothetical protein